MLLLAGAVIFFVVVFAAVVFSAVVAAAAGASAVAVLLVLLLTLLMLLLVSLVPLLLWLSPLCGCYAAIVGRSLGVFLSSFPQPPSGRKSFGGPHLPFFVAFIAFRASLGTVPLLVPACLVPGLNGT